MSIALPRLWRLLPLALLTACAGAPSSPPAAAEPDSPLYRLLLAEIAGARGRVDVALEQLEAVGSAVDDPRVARRTWEAAAYLERDEAALAAARRWLALAPEDPEARLALAWAALRCGAQAEALAALEGLLAAAPWPPAQTWNTLAQWLQRAGPGHEQAALQLMAELLARHGEAAEGWLAYAHLALAAEDLEAAERALQNALERAPHAVDAERLYAQLLARTGRAEQAAERLARLLAARPDADEARLDYARLLIDLDRQEAALVELRRLAERRRADPQVFYALALVALETEQPALAREALERLLSLGGHDDVAHYFLGRLAETEGQRERALSHYRRVQGGPHLLDAQLRIAALLRAGGDAAEAYRRLLRLRETFPDRSTRLRLYAIEAEWLEQDGDVETALARLDEALAQFPGDRDLLYTRALLYERLGRVAEAERDLRSVLLRAPEDAAALNALGYILTLHTDRLEEAHALIEAALRLEPEDPAILDSMGWVLYRMGRVEAARPYLERAYAGDRHAEIAAHLIEVLWRLGERARARALLAEALAEHPGDRHLEALRRRLGAEAAAP
ncbi:MAG: hypothetical protein KatS3mg121_1010 [Gammaproteobacteria bacterium]|nr:MAG: hypothetical protein KatS3mg121_1010 [Gammaproteobacteria bacterium]